MGRLITLSGPSCVGKGPLHAALVKFHPDLTDRLRTLVLDNDRAPRPGERDGVDYHFRPRAEIAAFRGREGFIVAEVRGDLQALALVDLRGIVRDGDAFFEGNPIMVRELQAHAVWREIDHLSIFLSPLSRAEVIELKTQARVRLAEFVADVMRRKLLRRTQRQKGILSLKDLENIERRATSAYPEMQDAWRFDCVIPNHDGEDSENWDAFYFPVGDARLTLHAFAELLHGQTPERAERWEKDLLA